MAQLAPKVKAGFARPFLKWAGGKTQLLSEIDARLPKELNKGKVHKYIEPFVGSGAVFFHIAQNYPIKEFVLLDINKELVLVYKSIQQSTNALIKELAKLENSYYNLDSEEQRSQFYYELRQQFNKHLAQINFNTINTKSVQRAAQFIFLNKTCYNGLYRVNRKGEFNVPFGRYAQPKILDADNLLTVSGLLKRAKIICADYQSIGAEIKTNSFVYFDPPYRPISKTANFTAYARENFNDHEQIRLSSFYKELDRKGAKLMLSNSDPKNEDKSDNFFEEQYQGFNMNRVLANRMINSNGSKRGKIKELLITNY